MVSVSPISKKDDKKDDKNEKSVESFKVSKKPIFNYKVSLSEKKEGK